MSAKKQNIRILFGAAAAVALLGATAVAAEKHPVFQFGPVPPQFVISPEDGARSHDHISIKADVAERL